MPTYEYRCEACKDRFEVFHSMSADPVDVCPTCGGHATKLLSGGAGLIFKGSGFYITDYKNKKESESKKKPDAKKDGAKKGSESSSKESSSVPEKKTKDKPSD